MLIDCLLPFQLAFTKTSKKSYKAVLKEHMQIAVAKSVLALLHEAITIQTSSHDLKHLPPPVSFSGEGGLAPGRLEPAGHGTGAVHPLLPGGRATAVLQNYCKPDDALFWGTASFLGEEKSDGGDVSGQDW